MKPYNGYIIELHRGEVVITAEQAVEWRKIVKEQEAREKETKEKEVKNSNQSCYTNNTSALLMFLAIPVLCVIAIIATVIMVCV